MTTQQDTGKKGEILAKAYLETNNYKVIHENWRRGQLEVDLIAEKDQMLIFVEVKTRSANFLVSPASSVNKAKQKAIIRAAHYYIEQSDSQQEARFDVVGVVFKGTSFEIEHIEDAFRGYAGR